jgi:thiol:disulfide interchange protein
MTMLGFIFRSGTYYLLWQKFKKQIITLLVSVGLVLLILGIYNDLFSVLKISNKESVLYLLLLKWFLILFIIGVNVLMLRRLSTKEFKESIKKEEAKKSKEVKLPLTQQEKLLQKEKLLTTTDLILAKYAKKKDKDVVK